MYFSQIATSIYSYRHRLSIAKGFRYRLIEESLRKKANIKIMGLMINDYEIDRIF